MTKLGKTKFWSVFGPSRSHFCKKLGVIGIISHEFLAQMCPQTYHSLQISQVCHHRKKYPSQKPKNILAQIVLIRSALYDFEIAFLQMILSFVIYIVFAPSIGSMLSPWRGESAASSCLPKSELSETVTLFEIVFFCN